MKKILSLFLLSFILILAACGNDEKEKTEKETPETEEPQVQDEVEKDDPVEEESDEPEEEPEVEEEPEEDNATEDEAEKSEPVEVAEADKIQKAVENIVQSDLENTTITKIRVNEDLSTDEEKYIVLIDLKWDVKNSAKTTYNMLEMYSDHLAAKMADYDKITDFVEFWEVPYLKEGDVSLKRTYENTGNGMFLKDEMNMIK